MDIKNVAFYHFFKPTIDLELARISLKGRMIEMGIRGSILLASEGINCSIAGPTEKMDAFLSYLTETLQIPNPDLKVSFTDTLPFKRSLVKIKPSIVCEPSQTPVDIQTTKAPYVTPEDLDRWIKEGKSMVLLDTRNDYEYELGRFKNSVQLGTKHFAEFEIDLEKAPQEWKNTPVVTFCTGGIRCEKAAPLMIQKGFKEVYQLQGGILNYFKQVGQSNFEGTCFVFDQRVALNSQFTAQQSCETRVS